MKTHGMKSTFILTAILLIAAICARAQDDAQLKQLAKRLVQSASVKKGDVVVISGGKHMIPLMEEVAIQVQMAGGFSNMWLATDRVQRAIYVDQPEDTLGQKNDYSLEWFRRANVVITLPTFEDGVKLVEGVSPTRLAKVAGQNEDRSKEINALPVRWVGINLPTAADAKLLSVDHAAIQKMTWSAINADYAEIAKKAARLKAMLQAGKQVRVTNPTGTDFTFSLDPARLIQVNDGAVTTEDAKSSMILERFATLPAGSISLAPIETSANGKVAVAKDWGRSGLIRNTRFEFRSGKVVNYTAETNANTFPDEIAPFSGPKDIIGSFSIGLNPEMRPMDAGNEVYYPEFAAGLVFVGVGDNKLLGGANSTNSGGWGWPIANATVTVDGKVVVKDGKLVF